jgi:hypothetical protein
MCPALQHSRKLPVWHLVANEFIKAIDKEAQSELSTDLFVGEHLIKYIADVVIFDYHLPFQLFSPPQPRE